MKHKYILLFLIGCSFAACHETTVDFNYTPAQPRAGESVLFSNRASAGEEWEWTFGDGSTSTSKSPTHTYKQPGTYTVILKVDGKSSLTKTHQLTVYDTIPNFACSDTVGIAIFKDVTFTALVYNPYNYPLSYEWNITSDVAYTQLSATNTAATYKVYFKQTHANTDVRLRVVLNNDTTFITHTYAVQDVQTTALLMRTQNTDYRQRIFGVRSEEVQPLSYPEGKALLDNAQDTIQVFNDSTFTRRALQATFPGIEGFRIANRKIYYRANGLFVANINGSNRVQIETQPTAALCVDMVDNRIYWAVADSIRYMALIGSENNQFTTIPSTLNTQAGIRKLAIDSTPR